MNDDELAKTRGDSRDDMIHLTSLGSVCHNAFMPDVFTKEKRSQVMGAIRARSNKDTELKLAAILRSARITGWRRHQRLPGRPDFAFARKRLALFVDGCFWHGCPKHGRQPGTNTSYWAEKLARNKARDRSVSRSLRQTGWTVIRIWEHHLSAPAAVSARIARALRQNCHSPFREAGGK
jgi:DNA mismatch endonuclease (patch repair protein)